MQRRNNIIVLLLMFWGTTMFAQNKADDIVGYYYSEDPFSGEGSQTYIYKVKDGTYQGKVCWVENKAKEHFLGLVFLKNLTFNAKENEWQHGEIKYPGKKGTYEMYMKFVDNKKLKVRGYWKISLLGKSMYWYKEEKQR
ncbi:MAG: DUF2147 domain-containing protein [Bacteroidales bacterium]|nr:DUF2147 domain-containing protein [Bacteroidales bacterium]